MTGIRPDSIGVAGIHSHFRTKRPDVVTLRSDLGRGIDFILRSANEVSEESKGELEFLRSQGLKLLLSATVINSRSKPVAKLLIR